YTSLGSGTWASGDLARNATDSTLWEATDGLGGADPAHVRYIVQAAGANGLVTLDTTLGAFYTPGPDVTQPQAPKKTTQLSLQSPPTTGTYREPVTVRALLTSNGAPLTRQTLIFGIGSERRRATTGADGIAETKLSLFQTPGTVDLRASFDESGAYLGSSDTRSFTIGKRATTLGLVPGCSPVQA